MLYVIQNPIIELYAWYSSENDFIFYTKTNDIIAYSTSIYDIDENQLNINIIEYDSINNTLMIEGDNIPSTIAIRYPLNDVITKFDKKYICKLYTCLDNYSYNGYDINQLYRLKGFKTLYAWSYSHGSFGFEMYIYTLNEHPQIGDPAWSEYRMSGNYSEWEKVPPDYTINYVSDDYSYIEATTEDITYTYNRKSNKDKSVHDKEVLYQDPMDVVIPISKLGLSSIGATSRVLFVDDLTLVIHNSDISQQKIIICKNWKTDNIVYETMDLGYNSITSTSLAYNPQQPDSFETDKPYDSFNLRYYIIGKYDSNNITINEINISGTGDVTISPYYNINYGKAVGELSHSPCGWMEDSKQYICLFHGSSSSINRTIISHNDKNIYKTTTAVTSTSSALNPSRCLAVSAYGYYFTGNGSIYAPVLCFQPTGNSNGKLYHISKDNVYSDIRTNIPSNNYYTSAVGESFKSYSSADNKTLLIDGVTANYSLCETTIGTVGRALGHMIIDIGQSNNKLKLSFWRGYDKYAGEKIYDDENLGNIGMNMLIDPGDSNSASNLNTRYMKWYGIVTNKGILVFNANIYYYRLSSYDQI